MAHNLNQSLCVPQTIKDSTSKKAKHKMADAKWRANLSDSYNILKCLPDFDNYDRRIPKVQIIKAAKNYIPILESKLSDLLGDMDENSSLFLARSVFEGKMANRRINKKNLKKNRASKNRKNDSYDLWTTTREPFQYLTKKNAEPRSRNNGSSVEKSCTVTEVSEEPWTSPKGGLKAIALPNIEAHPMSGSYLFQEFEREVPSVQSTIDQDKYDTESLENFFIDHKNLNEIELVDHQEFSENFRMDDENANEGFPWSSLQEVPNSSEPLDLSSNLPEQAVPSYSLCLIGSDPTLTSTSCPSDSEKENWSPSQGSDKENDPVKFKLPNFEPDFIFNDQSFYSTFTSKNNGGTSGHQWFSMSNYMSNADEDNWCS